MDSQRVLLAFLLVVPCARFACAQTVDPWADVGRILEAPGSPAGEGRRYAFPRSDLTVQVGDVTVATSLALGSWAGFAPAGPDTMVMGDLVVTPAELPAVLRQLSVDGISVTAVHNHLVGETPRVMYVHYEAHGNASSLAERVSRVLARTGAPRPVAAPAPTPVTIDTALVFQALGARGRANGAVVQLAFMLVSEPVTERGRPLPATLAYGSPVNIQATGRGRAVATGDFAVTARQLDPVLDALAAHGITTTAVHSHLVGESPPIYYVHFWAHGPLPDVVRGLRATLDAAR